MRSGIRQLLRALASAVPFMTAVAGGPRSTTAAEPAADSAPTPAPVIFTREDLMARLTRDLAAHFRFTGELQLELLRPWAPPSRRAAHWELGVLDYPATPSSFMLVRCRLTAEAGEVIAEPAFSVRAMVWSEGWVAREPIAAGAPFEPSVLEPRRIDLLHERDVIPADRGNAGYVFAHNVPAGRLLTWRDVSRRPLVRKGELVEVAAGEGRLQITLKAIAMENGAQGDTVVVRNPESRKNFAALVIDENRVQVRF